MTHSKAHLITLFLTTNALVACPSPVVTRTDAGPDSPNTTTADAGSGDSTTLDALSGLDRQPIDLDAARADVSASDLGPADSRAHVDAGSMPDHQGDGDTASLDGFSGGDARLAIDVGSPGDASVGDANIVADPSGSPGYCTSGGLCWDHPRPFGGFVHDFYRQPDGKIWSVGNAGAIGFFDGDDWIAVNSGSDQSLYAIDGAFADNIVAVGAGGDILYYNGVSWTPMHSGVTADLYGVFREQSGTAWAVGADATVLRFVAGSWQTLAPPAGVTQQLLAVDGSGPDDIWIVGVSRTILHWDGISLEEISPYHCSVSVSPSTWHWRDIVSVADQELLLVGETVTGTEKRPLLGRLVEGVVDCLDQAEAGGLHSVAARNGSDAWAVGGSGLAYHWDGVQWIFHDVGNQSVALEAVDVRQDGSVLVGGSFGVLGVQRAGQWTWPWRIFDIDVFDPNNNDKIIDMWRSSAGTLWALAEGGRLLSRGPDGWSWTDTISSFGAWPSRMTGVSDTELWFQGEGGRVWQYGSGPTVSDVVDTPYSSTKGMWAADSSNVFALFGKGVYRYNGGQWIDEYISGSDLKAITGLAAADVWVVAADCELLHRDNSGWAPVTGLPCDTSSGLFSDIDAIASDDIWIVGPGGLAYFFDGQSWDERSASPALDFAKVVSLSNGRALATTNTGGIYVYDGTAWGEALVPDFGIHATVLQMDLGRIFIGGLAASIAYYLP